MKKFDKQIQSLTKNIFQSKPTTKQICLFIIIFILPMGPLVLTLYLIIKHTLCNGKQNEKDN